METKDAFRRRAVAAGCAIGALLFLAVYLIFFSTTFRINETTHIYIDDDDTADSVSVKIKTAAQPGISCGFPVLAAVGGYAVKSGRYAIEPDDNMLGLYRKLRQGNQAPVRLTIRQKSDKEG